MDIVLAAATVVAAVVAWTAWESTMVSRLARDTRPLPRRNAAVAGAHRLTVVGQLGLVALAVVLAGLVGVPLWFPAAVTPPVTGAVLTLLLALGAAAAVVWAGRRGHRPQDRRALAAVVTTAFATEVLLRGFGLGVLDASGWPVTAAVLVAAVATGLLQAWRARVGSRAFGFVLATLLGFVLGLVVLLTGSVLAAAAVHVAVAALGLGRTFPARGHAPGCMCGHDHGAAGSHPAPASTATSTAAMTAGATTAVVAPATSSTAAPGTGTTDVTAGAPVAGHAHAPHAACGTTCDHAGTSACAACPLSTARV